MWVHVQNWIVQDGEIPELRIGSTLQNHAVRASCWSIRETHAQEGVTECSRPDPSEDNAPHYELTGTVVGGEEPSSVLLQVGGFRVLAEPIAPRQVPGTSSETYALERFSPDFFVPALGTRATVACRLEVMAEYEVEGDREAEDAPRYPGLRRDWTVRRLKLQHRALVPVPGQERTWKVDKVLSVDNIERMHRWADEKRGDHVTYLLDLELPS